MAESILTGIAGVYSVAADLSLRVYVIAVISRSAPGVNILAASPDLRRNVSIQVKANKPDATHARRTEGTGHLSRRNRLIALGTGLHSSRASHG